MELLALGGRAFCFVLHPPDNGALKVENVLFDRLWQHQDLDTGRGSNAKGNESRNVGSSREESISGSRTITVGTVANYRISAAVSSGASVRSWPEAGIQTGKPPACPIPPRGLYLSTRHGVLPETAAEIKPVEPESG
jgi:hypothetical protein